jgi:hypothetical protein
MNRTLIKVTIQTHPLRNPECPKSGVADQRNSCGSTKQMNVRRMLRQEFSQRTLVILWAIVTIFARAAGRH